MATKKGTKGKKNVTKSKAAKKAKKAKRAAPLARSKKANARRPKRSASPKTGVRKPATRKASKAKSAPKKKAVARSQPAGVHGAVRRRDRPGHIDPTYAEELRAQSGTPDPAPTAFIEGPRSASDDLAEERAEEVIAKATTGEDGGEDNLDQVVPEEEGGPFIQTNAAQEFAYDTDASNPKGAKREPFPTT